MNSRRPDFLGVGLSLGGYRWVERLDTAGAATALAIAQRTDLPEIVARVLAGRGVMPDDVEGFMDPSLRTLMPDPDVLTDMPAAAERIADAVAGRERIVIFGDYDVDGASSAAILSRFLTAHGQDARIYIPDRIFEGYGPNVEAVRQLAAEGYDLMVTVDCGATGFEPLAEARKLGLDVVVLDHHEVGVELPQAVAVVNPNRQDDLSGLGYMAAAGVVFMATVAIARVLRRRGWYTGDRKAPDLLRVLDLVALGTVCDVVPLRGLNRAFVVKGIAAMAHRGNRGLAALSDVARLGEPTAAQHLGFILGPRINAGGRIGDAALGSRLLASEDAAECATIAQDLDRLNVERREMERAALEAAYAEAEAEIGDGNGPPVLLTGGEGWHPGIVGLVASRLKDRFNRPAAAVALLPNGEGTGSARSVEGFDIGLAVRQAVAAGVLIKGGGHPMAAGLTVARERFGDLRRHLIQAFERDARTPDRHELRIDAALSARGATAGLVEILDSAGPYGAGHPEPLLALPHHRLHFVSATDTGHLTVELRSADGTSLRGIAFRAADSELGRSLLRSRGGTFHFAGHLGLDRYRGRVDLSFRLRDAAEVQNAG